jgi:hypothetical protein
LLARSSNCGPQRGGGICNVRVNHRRASLRLNRFCFGNSTAGCTPASRRPVSATALPAIRVLLFSPCPALLAGRTLSCPTLRTPATGAAECERHRSGRLF